MKKKNLISCCLALVALAIFAGCNDEQLGILDTKTKIPVTFSASVSNDGQTRTSLDEVSVKWAEGDYIAVYDANGEVNPFELIEGVGSTDAKFYGTVTSDIETYYALYPYQETTISGNVISGVVMPENQIAKDGDFDPSTNIMTAYSTDYAFYFRQAVCYIKIILDEDGYTKIEFKANGGEKLAGTVSLTVDSEGISTHTLTENGSDVVTLYPQEGESYFEAGTYYLAILPQTLSQGFTVTCYTFGDRHPQKVYNKSTDIFKRDKIISLGSITNWEWKHICQHYYAFGQGKAEAEEVDLGLPSGLKWSSVNLGATKPWRPGDFYAWGAVVPWDESYDMSISYKKISQWCHWSSDHDAYDWTNTPYYKGDEEGIFINKKSSWSKYFTGVDSKVQLDAVDDAAVYQWGDGWHTPTAYDWVELFAYTYFVWTENYKNSNMKGWIAYKVKNPAHRNLNQVLKTSPSFTSITLSSLTMWSEVSNIDLSYVDQYDANTDTHIFLPAGTYVEERPIGTPKAWGIGAYWTSTLNSSAPHEAMGIQFDNSQVTYYGTDNRSRGCNIRPVKGNSAASDIESVTVRGLEY